MHHVIYIETNILMVLGYAFSIRSCIHGKMKLEGSRSALKKGEHCTEIISWAAVVLFCCACVWEEREHMAYVN